MIFAYGIHATCSPCGSPMAAVVNGGGAVVEEEVVVVRVGVRVKLVRDAPSHGSFAALIRTRIIAL